MDSSISSIPHERPSQIDHENFQCHALRQHRHRKAPPTNAEEVFLELPTKPYEPQNEINERVYGLFSGPKPRQPNPIGTISRPLDTGRAALCRSPRGKPNRIFGMPEDWEKCTD